MTHLELRQTLKTLNWSGAEFSRQIGVSIRTARAYLAGTRAMPMPVIKLMEHFTHCDGVKK